MTTDTKDAAVEKRMNLTLAFCKLLGWTKLHFYEDHQAPSSWGGEPPAWTWDNPHFGFSGHSSNRGRGVTKLPAFFVDNNAALLLVEHMRKEGWVVGWHVNNVKNLEEIQFTKMCEGTYYELAPTLPLAICLAFAAANQLDTQ